MTSESVELIVNPQTGEVIDPRAVNTDALLTAHDMVMDAERELRSFRRQLDDELVRRADHEGRRSLTFDAFKVDVTPPTEKQWDVERLRRTLAELVGEGWISADKQRRCIRTKYEPAWSEIKTLLSDPRVRDQIEECFEEVDARRYVKVTRRG